MSQTYDFSKLKQAILFNTAEVLPQPKAPIFAPQSQHFLPDGSDQLDQEIAFLVDKANSSGEPICHYIGFEISGQIHIGTSIMPALKIKKLTDAGVHCRIFLADYHTWINGKLDGKIETIRQVAREYFGPIMLKGCEIVGCNMDLVQLVFAQDLYEEKKEGNSFWNFDMAIGKNLTLARVLKSTSVTGKSAGSEVDFSLLRYPVMQVTDTFFMQNHLVHAGLDQRKCHVLMREIAPRLSSEFALKIGGQKIKPIAIHHALLLGLDKPVETVLEENDLTEEERQSLMYLQQEASSGAVKLEDLDQTVAEATLKLLRQQQSKNVEVNKMSKSKPDSAIWVHDSYEEILRKLKKAYCPMPGSTFGASIEEVRSYLQEAEKDATENSQVQQFLDKLAVEQQWNPLMDWCQKMIFPGGQVVSVERKPEWGGNVLYQDFASLQKDYWQGKLHPMDLKTAVARTLANWFEPIYQFVQENPEPLELVKKAKK